MDEYKFQEIGLLILIQGAVRGDKHTISLSSNVLRQEDTLLGSDYITDKIVGSIFINALLQRNAIMY